MIRCYQQVKRIAFEPEHITRVTTVSYTHLDVYKRQGINGYTLIFNSHHLALAEHNDFETIESDMGSYTPRVFIVQPMKHRLQEKHTDLGKEISARIEDLRDLIEAFSRGSIKEK